MAKLKRKFGVRRGADEAQDRLSRDDHGEGRRAGAAQEADAAVAVSSATAGCAWRPRRAAQGYEFDDEIVGGSIPREVHSRGGQGDSGGGGARRARRLSARRLRGRAVRRLVPLGRLERDVVQDGRHSRVQDRGARNAGRCCSSRSTRWTSPRPTNTWATSSATSPRGAATSSAPSRRGDGRARACARSCRRRSCTCTPRSSTR